MSPMEILQTTLTYSIDSSQVQLLLLASVLSDRTRTWSVNAIKLRIKLRQASISMYSLGSAAETP